MPRRNSGVRCCVTLLASPRFKRRLLAPVHGLWTAPATGSRHSQIFLSAEAGKSIPFFGDGSSGRDYTYVSDIVSGILAALDYAHPVGAALPFDVFNLGNSTRSVLPNSSPHSSASADERPYSTNNHSNLAMFRSLGRASKRRSFARL